jgi:bacterioferritin (cytochrome b1)
MEKQALIDKLNKDLADEHAAIIRYLVHTHTAVIRREVIWDC